MYEIFAKLLKENNITPYKVSKDTKIAQTTLSDWKRNISEPKTDKLQKLADYFDVSIDYLLGKTDIKKHRPTNQGKADCYVIQLSPDLFFKHFHR